jgi:predicted RNA-binding Zn-ribbon protein involved in translation (DUF1610 family)
VKQDARSLPPVKATVASHAVKISSMQRRKTEAKFVCPICGADFTARHNLKRKSLSSVQVDAFSY